MTTWAQWMNGLAAAGLALFIAVPASADDAVDAALRTAMRDLDAAFQSQDPAKIRTMMTPDHTAVTFYYRGPQTVDQQVASLPGFKAEMYDFTEPTIVPLGDDAALVTFEKSYRGTFEGNPVPDRVFASEIWVKADGAWRERFYQETVIAE